MKFPLKYKAALLILVINIFPGALTAIQNLSPGDVGRQIANTHTLFAVFAVAVMLPPWSRAICRARLRPRPTPRFSSLRERSAW